MPHGLPRQLYILRLKRFAYPWGAVEGSILVNAINAWEARSLAAGHKGCDVVNAWLDPAYSTCRRLKPTPKSGVIMESRSYG